MVSPEFAADLREEVPDWVHEGLVDAAQGQALLERYAHVSDARGARGAAAERVGTAFQGVLYGTAGVLLGAAALVVLFVGLGVREDPGPFILAGLVLLAAGGALHAARVKAPLADAVLVAALVPLAAAAFPGAYAWRLGVGALPAMAVAVGVLAWRRDEPFVGAFAVIAFTVAAGAFTARRFDHDMGAAWLPLQALLLVGVVVLDRLVRRVTDSPAGAIAAATVPLAGIPLFTESVNLPSSEMVEIAIGLIAAAVLAGGLLVRHRGVVVGAAAVIAVDAVVFSFDVGGAVFGTLILVGLAALLVWQAEFLKGWFAERA